MGTGRYLHTVNLGATPVNEDELDGLRVVDTLRGAVKSVANDVVSELRLELSEAALAGADERELLGLVLASGELVADEGPINEVGVGADGLDGLTNAITNNDSVVG